MIHIPSIQKYTLFPTWSFIASIFSCIVSFNCLLLVSELSWLAPAFAGVLSSLAVSWFDAGRGMPVAHLTLAICLHWESHAWKLQESSSRSPALQLSPWSAARDQFRYKHAGNCSPQSAYPALISDPGAIFCHFCRCLSDLISWSVLFANPTETPSGKGKWLEEKAGSFCCSCTGCCQGWWLTAKQW